MVSRRYPRLRESPLIVVFKDEAESEHDWWEQHELDRDVRSRRCDDVLTFPTGCVASVRVASRQTYFITGAASVETCVVPGRLALNAWDHTSREVTKNLRYSASRIAVDNSTAEL
jgi:hypothetical protein